MLDSVLLQCHLLEDFSKLLGMLPSCVCHQEYLDGVVRETRPSSWWHRHLQPPPAVRNFEHWDPWQQVAGARSTACFLACNAAPTQVPEPSSSQQPCSSSLRLSVLQRESGWHIWKVGAQFLLFPLNPHKPGLLYFVPCEGHMLNTWASQWPPACLVTSIHLCIVYSCFLATKVELSSGDRDLMVLQRGVYFLPSSWQKRVPTPGLHNEDIGLNSWKIGIQRIKGGQLNLWS